jgi:hypothetical protein
VKVQKISIIGIPPIACPGYMYMHMTHTDYRNSLYQGFIEEVGVGWELML